MINVVEYEDSYHITFPYDYTIKELVKEVPGRKWNSDERYWYIPKNHLGMLINQFKGTDYEDMVSIKSTEHLDVNSSLDEKQVIPNIDISGVTTYVKPGSHLYEHQIDFLKYAIYRQEVQHNMNGFLCTDLMGLGKSLESLNLALYNHDRHNFKHCLILCCINVSKYNWEQEIRTQTNGLYEGYILGTRKQKSGKINYNGSSKDKLSDLITNKKYSDDSEDELPYFLILNIEALRMKLNRKYSLTDKIIELINNHFINMIIIDEVHKNVSPSSQQGKQLLRIKKATKTNSMWIPMTGTPIVNKPTDLFLPLRLIEAHSINSYYAWNQNFCVYGGYGDYEIIGYKNIDKLKTLLQPNMIRRLKEDVLDLPDKIEFIEFVENTPYQNKLSQTITDELWKNREDIVSSLNPLAKMLRLRQVNGSPELVDLNLKVDSEYIKYNAKLQRLLEIVAEIISRNEKVIIFSNWVEPLRTIYRHLFNSYKLCSFTGTMSEADRQKNKNLFLNDPEYKIILGTIGALGTTHTLTSANNIIFYDEPWTSADRQQAVDRIHRISATQTCNIYTLLAKGTIDERVHEILYGKETVANYIVDNKLDIYNNPDLFAQLLGRK